MWCLSLALPLTGYTEIASEGLACFNAVPCHHTDSVSHSIHQRQSCDIPSRSTEHHCSTTDCDLTPEGCIHSTMTHSQSSIPHAKLTVYSKTGCPPSSLTVMSTWTVYSVRARASTSLTVGTAQLRRGGWYNHIPSPHGGPMKETGA